MPHRIYLTNIGRVNAAPYRTPLPQLVRKTLTVGLPLVLIALLVIAAYYHSQLAAVERHARTLSAYTVQNLSVTLEQTIRDIKGDALLIASHPLLTAALNNPNGPEARQLTQEWEAFAAQKRTYDQIRLLSTTGQELLRINLSPDGAAAVPRDQLQNKVDRYYFREAMTLAPGQVYLSPLDLNVEHGQIEQPLKPMLRVGVPVADRQGHKVGVIILNYLAATLLSDIADHSTLSDNQTLLLNANGYYLRGFQPADEWAFMYPEQQRPGGQFATSYPAVWNQLQTHPSGQLSTDGGVFSYKWVSTGEGAQPGPFDRRFAVVSAVTAAHLAALERPYRDTAWAAALMTVAAILLISMLASRYRLRELFAVQQLREVENSQRLILETVGEGIFGLDTAARLTFVNSRAAELTGYTPDEMMGHTVDEIIDPHSTDPPHRRSATAPVKLGLDDGTGRHSDSDVFWRKNGESFPVEYISNPIIRDGHLIGAVVSFFDITDRKNAEQHIQYLVLYDALTDVANRNLLLERLTQQIAASRRANQLGALLYIDIDRFKQINDALGHTHGDTILIEIARRLSALAQEGETVARIGSDEFVLLRSATYFSAEQAAHEAQLVADDIMLALEQPFPVNGEAIRLTGSIGITLFPTADDDAVAVLAKADTAAASAKAAGRHTTRFFTEDMELDTKDWLNVHNRLLEALANDTFNLVYQPKVRHDGKVIGLEALLRWDDPVLGSVSPARFVPIAEQSGLIVQLSDFVLATACRQVRAWLDAGLAGAFGHIAVNISPTHFADKDFVAYIRNHIDSAGIPPHTIELEITEGTLISDIADTRAKVDTLREFGIRFSIDDFGTGYSSLSYLQQLPLDRLKIDRAFVSGVDKNRDRQTIVEAIIQLAHSLSLEVIAEGVETEAEMRFLLDAGCHEFQGYHFFRPMKVIDLTELLLRQSEVAASPDQASFGMGEQPLAQS